MLDLIESGGGDKAIYEYIADLESRTEHELCLANSFIVEMLTAWDSVFAKEGAAITRDDISTYWKVKRRVHDFPEIEKILRSEEAAKSE